jgi:hypothetical protein
MVLHTWFPPLLLLSLLCFHLLSASHHLPCPLSPASRRRGMAWIDVGVSLMMLITQRTGLDAFGIHVPQKKNNNKSQGNTQNIAPGGQQVINKKIKMPIK